MLILKHLFVEEAGAWIRRIPTWILYSVLIGTTGIAWLIPDVIPGLEEGLVAIIYLKIAKELVRRRMRRLEKKDV